MVGDDGGSNVMVIVVIVMVVRVGGGLLKVDYGVRSDWWFVVCFVGCRLCC